MVMGNSLFIPLIPHIQATFQLTTVESGWVLTSFSIPAALFVLVGGIISDRFGRKTIAIVGLVLIIIGCAISAVSLFNVNHVWYWLILGRVLQGIGAGVVSPLALAFVADLFEGQKRMKAIGGIEVFNGVGKLVSPVIGGLILYVSWNISFVIYLFVAMVALAGIYIAVNKDTKIKKRVSLKHTVVEILRIGKTNWRWLLPIIYGGGVGMFLLFGYLFYLSYLAEQHSPFPNEWNGVIVALPLIALVVCSYMIGQRLKNNTDSYKIMMIVSVFVMITGTLSLFLQHSFLLTVIAMFIFSAGLGCFLPAANAALSVVVTDQMRGTIFFVLLNDSLFRCGIWTNHIRRLDE